MKPITALEAEEILGQRVNPHREYFVKDGQVFYQMQFADLRVLWMGEPEHYWEVDEINGKSLA